MPGPPGDPSGGDENPFAAPSDDFADASVVPQSEAEAIRRRHLGRENDIRIVGGLSIFCGLLFLAGGAVLLSFGADRPPQATARELMPAAACLGLGAIGLFVGIGLRRRGLAAYVSAMTIGLACLVGLGASIFCASGLGEIAGISFPLAIVGAIFYVLAGAKARRIFAPGYREVVARTPHLVPRSGGCLMTGTGCALVAIGAIILSIFAAIAGSGGGR